MVEYSRYPFTPGKVLRILADAALLQAALAASLVARLLAQIALSAYSEPFDVSELFWTYTSAFTNTAWPLTVISLLVFYVNGFYTYGHYYQGRYKAFVVLQAVSISYLVYAFLSYFFSGGISLPRAALVLAWFFSVGLLVGARMWSLMWERFVRPEREAARRQAGTGRNILVIGGAGYIGSALLPKLLDQGYHVRLLDVLMYGESPIESIRNHPQLELIQGDFRHVENVVEAMQGMDSVVHLGAIVGDPACNLDEDLTIDINLSATRMIAELAKSAGVNRFVFASTCSVYGACDEMLDEHSLVKPVSLYGHTKLASEQVLLGMAKDGFSPTIVRFATIYGLSGRTRFDLVVNLLTAKAKIDGVITIHGGDQWRPFVHVDDAAASLALILDAPQPMVASQIFNVGSNEQNYTIQQIGELVYQHVVSATLEVSDNDSDHRNYRVDFSKIRNHLGFQPQWTVEQGIEQVLEAIANGQVNDYNDVQYSNVAFLMQEGTSHLARDRWARQLLQELADR